MTTQQLRAGFFAVIASMIASTATASVASAQEAAASAPDRSMCHAAYEQGQRLRRGKKLREAREKLMMCARNPCPAAFQPECAKWLGELDAQVPTVVVALEGRMEGTEARVLVDGVEFAPTVDGIAREIDPGPHEFVVQNDRTRLVTRAAVVEGTKAQRIVFRTGISDGEPDPSAKRRGIPPLAIGLGALGIGALGTSAFFGVRGIGEKSDIDGCSPFCAQTDVDAARRSFLVADIALGVGVLAVAGAIVLYVTRPYEARPLSGANGVIGRPLGVSF